MLPILLKELFINLVLPVAVDTVKSYVKNSKSNKDDLILDIAKDSSKYLAKRTNNNVTKKIADELNNSTMRR